MLGGLRTIMTALATVAVSASSAAAASPAPVKIHYPPFDIRLRSSSASPSIPAFKEAVVRAFAEAGLPHGVGADGRFVRLAPGDARPSAIDTVDMFGASIEIGQLSDAVCAATFAAMGSTKGFVAPPDAGSATIMLKGAAGRPPPGYRVASVQIVSSPAELCAALKPAFDRWAAKAQG
jgi:hypothetical protein